MARIFQDSAGTIPVTTFDQPVGLIQRAAGTVDLVQSVSGSRPTMARWPRGGRRNLLTWTEDFSNAVWGPKNGIALSSALDPEGGMTATRLQFSGESQLIHQDVSGEIGQYTGSVYLKGTAGDTIALRLSGTNGLLFTLTGEWDFVSDTQSSVTYVSVNTYSGATARDVLVWHPQLELGTEATPFQRVTTANDVTEDGVESLWHLYNDGGDSMQTDGPVPAGTYGYAYVDPCGEITFDTRVSDGINPVQVADAPGRYLDLLLRGGDFSAGEKAAITDYWERLYK